jgi:hypothetical protein
MVPPRARVLVEQRPHRVGDLAPSAVADGHVHPGSAGTVAGALLGRLERDRVVGRQQVQRADHPQPPRVAVLGQLAGEVLDDLQQRVQFLGRRRRLSVASR